MLSELLQAGVDVRSTYLQEIDTRIEFLVSARTGELLTNPYETIINCVADRDVLVSLAAELSIEVTDYNLDSLFEAIVKRIENHYEGAIL